MSGSSFWIHILVGIASASLVLGFEESSIQWEVRKAREAKVFVPPPENPNLFTFGYEENASDILWLRVIQDIDVCDQKASSPLSDTGTQGQKAPRCERGWVFRMLNAITELTPDFRMPYAAGAVTLSVLVDDREGATQLFEKGIKRFPEDWTIAYRAAYHYLYEAKDNIRSAELLVQAGKNGAPNWVHSLAGKLLTEEGKAALAKPVLEEALARQPDGPGSERIRMRLKKVNAILAGQKPSAD